MTFLSIFTANGQMFLFLFLLQNPLLLRKKNPFGSLAAKGMKNSLKSNAALSISDKISESLQPYRTTRQTTPQTVPVHAVSFRPQNIFSLKNSMDSAFFSPAPLEIFSKM